MPVEKSINAGSNAVLPQGAPRSSNAALLFSALFFRIGLFSLTFEQDRFGGIQLSDYFLLTCVLLLLFRPTDRLKSWMAAVPIGGYLLVAGGILSLVSMTSMSNAAAALARLFALFILFAPLAGIHAKDVRVNSHFILGGISANCLIAMIQAWVFPGIVNLLSVNPVEDTDYGSSIGRFIGLTSHPNVLGLSAALGILIGVALFLFDKNPTIRWILAFEVLLCAIGALLSGSRTALVALVPALLIFSFFERRSRGTVVKAILAIGLMFAFLSYFFPNVVSSYSERIDTQGFVDYDRLLTAATALTDIAQRPIVGWGVDHFDDAGQTFLVDLGISSGTHLTLLQFWYAVGILGAVGFVLVFFGPTIRMIKLLRVNLPLNVRIMLSLGVSVCLLLFIVSFLQPLVFNRFFYMPIFVFAGYASFVAKRVEVQAKSKVPALRLAPKPQPAS
jgi:O-antigen ligase/polysaccharide polymerase Wzy-like membrane protein